MDGNRCKQRVSVSGVIMFCVAAANSAGVNLVIHDTHKWMSLCHVAVTEHGFDNPKARCFCVREDKKND